MHLKFKRSSPIAAPCCLRTCLSYSSLRCLWMCLFYSSLCCHCMCACSMAAYAVSVRVFSIAACAAPVHVSLQRSMLVLDKSSPEMSVLQELLNLNINSCNIDTPGTSNVSWGRPEEARCCRTGTSKGITGCCRTGRPQAAQLL
jgi:hypothetical protein